MFVNPLSSLGLRSPEHSPVKYGALTKFVGALKINVCAGTILNAAQMKLRLKSEDKHALIFLLALLLGCLLPFNLRPKYLWERLADGSHFILFGMLTFLLARSMHSRGFEVWRAACYACVTVLCMAGGIELIQPYFYREESMVDFVNGALGVVLAAIYFFTARNSAAMCGLWAAAAISTGLIVFKPAYLEWEALRNKSAMFPLIADFEGDWERVLWVPINHENLVLGPTGSGRDGRALIVSTRAGSYSGAEYRANDSDWRKFNTLHFYARAENAPTTLNLRIDDNRNCRDYDSRYNGTFNLGTDWKEFRVELSDIKSAPARRELNLAQVRRLLFFVKEPQAGRFYLDRVELN